MIKATIKPTGKTAKMGKSGDPMKAIVETVENAVEEMTKVIKKTVTKKVDKVADYRREASRMAALANKRLNRLESNSLQDSPAYRGYLEKGGERFSVRGKTYNQVQAEVARMKAFIDANTSTVRGVNNYLREIASNTGIKYSNLTELRKKAPKFFELANKVEQYLRTVDDMASAIGYQKIWEQINVYVQSNKIDLDASENDVEKMIGDVTQAIREYEKPEYMDFSKIDGAKSHWFKLPKE